MLKKFAEIKSNTMFHSKKYGKICRGSVNNNNYELKTI